MSQEKKPQGNVVSDYEVALTYHVMDFDEAGKPKETKKEREVVKMFALKRRNMAHSKLAFRMMNIVEFNPDETIDIAIEYARCCVANEAQANDICADPFAALELYRNEKVQEDIGRFFMSWDYLKTLPMEKASKKE